MQGGQNRSKLFSVRGEVVFYGWRDCRVLRTINDPVPLKLAEFKRKSAPANARKQPMQFVKAFCTPEEMANDSKLPFPRYRL